MGNARDLSILAQGASTAGVLAGGYGGTSLSSVGSVGNVLFTTNGTSWSSTQKIVQGTSVSASGTSIDFTNIPSWVKRITVAFSGLSTNGVSGIIVQLGSTTFTTSGYLGAAAGVGNGVSPATQIVTNGISLAAAGAGTDLRNGGLTIVNITGNLWTGFGSSGFSNTAYANFVGGSVTIGGTLDRVRLTTVNGTDTFDAGSVNILYE